MEKREYKLHKKWSNVIAVVFVVIICVCSTILPSSALYISTTNSDIYSMPLDLVFEDTNHTAGVINYKLTGYLFTPLLNSGDAYVNYVQTELATDYGNESYFSYYEPFGESVVGNRLLTTSLFLVNDVYFYDYIEQSFTLRANDSVIAMGTEFIHLYTQPDSDAYYNAWVSFDYKIAGDTTVHHYEDGVNSTDFVSLIPSANELGVVDGDLVYVFNYVAEIYYVGDSDRDGTEYYPRLGVSAISIDEKNANTFLFMQNHERLIAGSGTPPVINNAWLLQSVTSFFNFEIFPGFSIGGVMGILFAITVVIAVLKFVAGG